jgi:hypothetical protein
MDTRSRWTAGWLLSWGLGAALSSAGCATQESTAQALAIAGTAAVIVGASMAADGGCYAAAEEGPAAYCSSGLSKSTRQAGTAVAVAGVGVAAAGYALQPKGPDRLHRPAPAPRAPTQPYRLIRTPVAEPEPSEPDPSEPDPSDPADPSDPTEPEPEQVTSPGH